MSKTLVKAGKPRSAVVTGAARGIGRAVAAELVGRGYQVVVTDLDVEAAKVTASEIGAALGLGLDVTDVDATRGVLEEARVIAPLGAWVCNAGLGYDGDLNDLTEQQVRALVDVNLLGVVWGVRTATDAFRRQAVDGLKGGDIGIVASLSSHGPVPGLSMYAATKAAVLSLATSLHVELRGEKIRVHAICPDGVDTRMLADMEPGGRAQSLVRSGTLLQPTHVARVLVDMFGTRKVYRTMPAWRGVLMRTTSVAPGPTMRLEPLLRRQGQRKIRKGR
ncbi:SDR family oxidoreductase [Aeromicrobium terrae]|uniref:SDR family oxidoreductase n=1 Tax=Aeromicrobium terrae TaxID=2498846 RepID=A0A5C8NQU4_9ACTN|nr:SDR family oxidoreductase [Aeromicrobium terrae]TXL63251.1 SDR family oxidoreductase [Aeromicrobium terrae]